MARTGSAGREQRRECTHIRNLIEALDLSIETPSGARNRLPCAEETMSMIGMEPLRISSGWSKYVRVPLNRHGLYVAWHPGRGFPPGSATVRLRRPPSARQSGGAVHGGVLATALDVAMALAVDTALTTVATPERWICQCGFSTLRRPMLRLYWRLGSSKYAFAPAFADATIRTDSGVLLATSSGVFSVLRSNKASRLCKPSPVVSLDNSLKSE